MPPPPEPPSPAPAAPPAEDPPGPPLLELLEAAPPAPPIPELLELDDDWPLGSHLPVLHVPPGQLAPSGLAGLEQTPVAGSHEPES